MRDEPTREGKGQIIVELPDWGHSGSRQLAPYGKFPNGAILSGGFSIDSMLSGGIIDWGFALIPLVETM